MDQLLSPSTITAVTRILVEHVTDRDGLQVGLFYSYHNDIENIFGGSNIEISSRDVGGMRPRTRDTLERVNRDPSQHTNLKRLVENIVDKREYRYDEDRHLRTVVFLNDFLRPDGFELRQLSDRWRLFPINSGQTVTAQLDKTIKFNEYESVRNDFERALAQISTDPEGAVTSACSLVESVCKCILEEMKAPMPNRQDIQGLSGTLAKELNLSPARTDITPDIKQILQGLLNVAAGIGALRTHSGDAHGRGKTTSRLDTRTAYLAVHSASTLALFYIETWQLQQRKRR